jgi:hypothetical protein
MRFDENMKDIQAYRIKEYQYIVQGRTSGNNDITALYEDRLLTWFRLMFLDKPFSTFFYTASANETDEKNWLQLINHVSKCTHPYLICPSWYSLHHDPEQARKLRRMLIYEREGRMRSLDEGESLPCPEDDWTFEMLKACEEEKQKVVCNHPNQALGIARARRQGKYKGRAKGSKNKIKCPDMFEKYSKMLRMCEGNVSAACDRLQVSRPTFYKIIRPSDNKFRLNYTYIQDESDFK